MADEVDGESEGKEFAKRLRLALGDEPQSAFAERAGFSVSGFRKYLHGTMPPVDTAARIAQALNVQLLWLATGDGPMRAQRELSIVDEPTDDDDVVYLPLYDITVAAGAGGLVISSDVSRYLPFPTEAFLRALPSWAPPNARVGVVQGIGDSMQPTIQDGDLIMFVQDVEERVVDAGGVFVFSYDDRQLVKRLHVQPNGDLLVISDNPVYPTWSVPRVELEHRVQIDGYVFWAGGKLRSVR